MKENQTPLQFHADLGSQLSNGQAIRRLLKFAWRYRVRVLMLLMLQGLLLLTAVLAIQLGGFAIDWIKYRHAASVGEVVATAPSLYGWRPTLSQSAVLQVCLIAAFTALVAIVRAVLNNIYTVSNGKFINEEMVIDLRNATFTKLQQLGLEFYNNHDSSSLINRLTSDIQMTRSFVDGVIVQIAVLAMSFGFYITAMFRLHVMLTIATLATTPLLYFMTRSFSRKIRPQYDKNRELFDAMMLRVNENAEGQTALKGFGLQQRQIELFREATVAVEKQQRDIFRQVSTFTPLVQFLTQFNLVILLVYGGYLVSVDELALGAGLIVFAGLIQQFSAQVTALSNITNTIEQSLAGARRVFEVLDAPVRITDPIETKPSIASSAKRPKRLAGNFELRQVSFHYQSRSVAGSSDASEIESQMPWVLRQVNLSLRAGSRTAIVGEIGSGKSTLLQMLPRFYDPICGVIKLEGQDLRDYDLATLRRSIGFVFQEPFLFSDTIAANIAFGNPQASEDEILRAARIANVDSFVSELQDGYNSQLGQNGLKLSGGQRQRLALARALLFDPPILLLDDPTSAVDAGTEHQIWEALDIAFENRTSVIVTNRLNTLANVDQIINLQEGRTTDATRPQLLHGSAKTITLSHL